MSSVIVGMMRHSVWSHGGISARGCMRTFSNLSIVARSISEGKDGGFQSLLHPTWLTMVWAKLGVDVVYMPQGENGEKFVVFARDDMLGWVKGYGLKANSSVEVVKFLFEDVVCWHGYPERIVMDDGPENKKETEDLLALHGVWRVSISTYHPQSNELVE